MRKSDNPFVNGKIISLGVNIISTVVKVPLNISVIKHAMYASD